MALTTTTLSAAITSDARKITVASASGLAAGMIVQIDNEQMKVAQDYSSGTSVPVLRGQGGTAGVAHNVTANVTFGVASDFDQPPLQLPVNLPIGTHARRIVSVTAAGALEHPKSGEDLVIVLNGTDVLAMTLTSPSKDIDGCFLYVLANGAAAHTVTYTTTGFGGAGASYDVLTANGTGTAGFCAVACNGLWILFPAITGTLTNVAWALA